MLTLLSVKQSGILRKPPDILSAMFSSVENTLLFLVWIIIIIPSLIYAAHSYKPKDAVGYISSAIIWCIAGLFAILSPLSLLLFFAYRQLYKLFKSRKNHKISEQSKSLTSAGSPTKTPTQGGSISTNQPPAYRICKFIWSAVYMFSYETGSNLMLNEQAYLWTIFFYVIVKNIRRQAFANEVYSHFDITSRFLLRKNSDHTTTALQMRSAYRELRLVLNGSRIDPRTADGMDALWYLTTQWVYRGKTCPTNAKNKFLAISQYTLRYSLKVYENQTPSTSASSNTTRYSLCEQADASLLPIETAEERNVK